MADCSLFRQPEILEATKFYTAFRNGRCSFYPFLTFPLKLKQKEKEGMNVMPSSH